MNQVQDQTKAKENLIATLADVGAVWAAHGLRVGKMALEASALTLEKTALALDELARAFDKKAEEKAAAAPIDVTPSEPAEEPKTT